MIVHIIASIFCLILSISIMSYVVYKRNECDKYDFFHQLPKHHLILILISIFLFLIGICNVIVYKRIKN